VRPLLKGRELSPEEMPEEVRKFFDTPGIREACERIRQNVHTDVPGWLQWLRRPSKLGEVLKKYGIIELPIDDPRVRPFLLEVE
jgi:hypothetical protein